MKDTIFAKGMFVKSHTTNNNKEIISVSINVNDVCQTLKEHYNKDANGNPWVNIKLIPRKSVSDKGLTHVPVIDTYFKKNSEQKAMENLEELANIQTKTADLPL
jgi:hypothetical protein